MVDVPSFMVRVDNEKHIEFANTSPLSGSGLVGRVKRKNLKNKKKKEAEASEKTEDE